jgi:hypothetical protein
LSAPKTGPGKERGAGEFGTAVALSPNGKEMLICGPSDHAGIGAAWRLEPTRAGWVFNRKLIPPTQGAGARIGAARFGSSVALARSGGLALIGAPADQPLGSEDGSVGAAWVFARSGTSWTDEQKLTAPVNGPDEEIDTDISGGEFGSSVAFAGTGPTALIGGDDDNLAGAAWVFAAVDGVWTERQKLTAPTTGPDRELNGSGNQGGEFGFTCGSPPECRNGADRRLGRQRSVVRFALSRRRWRRSSLELRTLTGSHRHG